MIWALSLAVLAAMTGVMLAAWAYGLARNNGGWTDVFWTFGTGAVLAAAALYPLDPGQSPQPRQWVVAGLVVLWSLRLGSYVATRVAGHPEDPRYAKFREDWGADYRRNMLFVTLPQAPASALLALSVLVAARTPGHDLALRDVLGVAVLMLAIGGEALADTQMKQFKADPGNKGKVADVGLWGWSRHPNYFFEWFGWLAYPVIGLSLSYPWGLATLLAPVFMYWILVHVTGIPPLEAQMLRSRGARYADYQARTSPFFPLPPHA